MSEPEKPKISLRGGDGNVVVGSICGFYIVCGRQPGDFSLQLCSLLLVGIF